MVATQVIAALACVAGASAFQSSFKGAAVANRVKPTSTMSMQINSLEEMSGATAPVPYWDPAGLAAKVDDQELQKYREAELKHGRVAMLATLGMVVQENFHPFFGTAGRDIGPAAFHLQETMKEFDALPLALVCGVGAVEFLTIDKGWSRSDYKETGLGAGFVANLKEDYFPGDLGFDPLGLYPSSPEERTNIRNKELNNGRLAMIAIWGMWAQELVDGLPLAEHYAKFGFGPAQ